MSATYSRDLRHPVDDPAVGRPVLGYSDRDATGAGDGQPAVALSARHVVDIDRLTIGLDDLAAYHDAGGGGLLAGHLQFLPRIAIKAIGIDRSNIAPEA
jgi:hypothetical protein